MVAILSEHGFDLLLCGALLWYFDKYNKGQATNIYVHENMK